MQAPVKLSKDRIIDKIQRYALDDERVRPVWFWRNAATIHCLRRSFSAILHPDARTMIWPRTSAVLDHRIFETMRRGRCELNQFVKEILRMSFDVAEGDSYWLFGTWRRVL
jgi:hypothetical protein